MDYLELVDRRWLYVYPDRRDWADFAAEPHIAYHTRILSAVANTVIVKINAATVPAKAVLHVGFFIRLAAVVRGNFANVVQKIEVADASTAAQTMYRALLRAGCISTATVGKIVFVSTSKKND